MERNRAERIFVAGHRGMVGSALIRALKKSNIADLLTASRQELDLLDQHSVEQWFKKNKPSQVYLAAAKVGGIHANSTYPADFIYENLTIQSNVIRAAHLVDVQKVLFLGSSCIYPKLAEQPIKEQALLTGILEPTNEPYAVAKIAGIKLCESFNRQFGRDYRSVMPTNLYGPCDNFHLENSHVVPALLRKFHEATIEKTEEVVIWGTGNPLREFLHVDDMADACIYIMNLSQETYRSNTSPTLSHINVGTGLDCSIRELANMIAEIAGYTGHITFDTTKPDGTPRKLLDVSRLNSLGWRSSIDLASGLRDAYVWYVKNVPYCKR